MINIIKFYKNSRLGKKACTEEEAEYIEFTIPEFNKIITKYENELHKLQKELKDSKLESKNINKKNKEDAEKRIESILSDSNNEIKRLEGLNKDLKNMCRIRANKARGIADKKNHFGYLFAGAKSIKYGYKLKGEHIELDAWFVKVQTPYNILLEYKNIFKEIERDLPFLAQALGIEKDFSKEILKMTKSDIEELWNTEKENFYFLVKPMMNAKIGFWELELYTRDAITVPEYMLNQKTLNTIMV